MSSSTPVAFTFVATRGQAPNVRQRASTAVAEVAVAAFRARMCTLVWAVASPLCLRARVRLDRLAFVDASSIETLKSDPVQGGQRAGYKRNMVIETVRHAHGDDDLIRSQ